VFIFQRKNAMTQTKNSAVVEVVKEVVTPLTRDAQECADPPAVNVNQDMSDIRENAF
jgi:hypothetical protein